MKDMKLRKHRIQMTQEEIAVVESYVHSQAGWHEGIHSAVRMMQKGVGWVEYLETAAKGEVIEVSSTNGRDISVLLRKDFSRYSVCVVVNLNAKRIVTVFKNDLDDRHATLNTNKYRWNVHVPNVIAAVATA